MENAVEALKMAGFRLLFIIALSITMVTLTQAKTTLMKENLIRQIENYPPFNEQEEKDKALILGWISNNENAFSRPSSQPATM